MRMGLKSRKKVLLPGDSGFLFLNGKNVGEVKVRGTEYGWSFGDFAPSDTFVEFANVFGEWSLLMHADGADEPLSKAASEELRRTEYAIDSLQAELYIPKAQTWHRLAQLNIDGKLIEWKET